MKWANHAATKQAIAVTITKLRSRGKCQTIQAMTAVEIQTPVLTMNRERESSPGS
jgi:hypothetical protein